jgi:glycosyltransferase involved in cell wall biosynthesis
MSVHHDLDCILETARILQNKNISFVFIGEGIKKESLQTKTQQLGLDNVVFLPFQSYDALPYSITSGDINIISQIKGTEGLCVSCKLYTALATGKPVIALIGKNSEISQVISENNCGYVIDSYNPEDLANAVHHLATDENLTAQMGLNARNCFVESYTKEHAMDKYHNIVKEFESIP